MENEDTVQSGFKSVLKAHIWAGIRLIPLRGSDGNQKPEKCQPPASRFELMGTMIDLRSNLVSNTEKRVDAIREWCTRSLEANKLTPGEASKLRGRLGFA